MTLKCIINIDSFMVSEDYEGCSKGYVVINTNVRHVAIIDTDIITYHLNFTNVDGMSKFIKHSIDTELKREYQEINLFVNKVVNKPVELKEHEHDYNIIMLQQYRVR